MTNTCTNIETVAIDPTIENETTHFANSLHAYPLSSVVIDTPRLAIGSHVWAKASWAYLGQVISYGRTEVIVDSKIAEPLLRPLYHNAELAVDHDRIFCDIHDGIFLDSNGICPECWRAYLNTLHTGNEPIVLDQLQRECGSWARTKNYRTTSDTIESKLLMLYSEIAEAVEEYRNHHPVTEVYYNGNKPEGVGIELADLTIRVLEFCDWQGIDLAEMIRLKMAYNWTREPRNGGKLI